MAHNMLTDDIVTAVALDHFENNLVVFKHSTRKFERFFEKNGGSARGDTIRIRKPNFAEVREGWTADWKDIDEEYVNLTIDKPIGRDIKLTEPEMHMDLTSAEEQIIKPAMIRLANKCDEYMVSELMKSPNFVGVPGTSPSALSTFLDGQAILDDYCAPDDDLMIALSPQMDVDMVDALKGLLNPDQAIAQQYKTGRMRQAAGFKWARTQNTKTHTCGGFDGAGLTKGASQSGASITTDDWTASQTGVLVANDKIAFTGCDAVNPVTKVSTGRLKTFRVTANVDSDGSGDATVPISPAIVLSGPNQNVSAAPTDDGAIQHWGAAAATYADTVTRLGLMWHKLAIAHAFCPLDNPDGQGAKGRTMTDDKLGISMRYTRQWSIDQGVWKLRFDVFLGVAILRDEWTLNVAGGA